MICLGPGPKTDAPKDRTPHDGILGADRDQPPVFEEGKSIRDLECALKFMSDHEHRHLESIL